MAKELNMPITNILFSAGGRFDLLLPKTRKIQERVNLLQKEVDTWLFKNFKGELSIQTICLEIAPADFFDFSSVYRKAEDRLLERKARKFAGLMDRDDFFKAMEKIADICPSCRIAAIQANEPMCEVCTIHRDIGRYLPKKKYLSFIYGPVQNIPGFTISFEKFGHLTVVLQDKNEVKLMLSKKMNARCCLYRINPENEEGKGAGLDFIEQNLPEQPISFGFKFFGNAAPLACKDWPKNSSSDQPTKKGDVLEFEQMAALSTGAKYLGVLKMDVDYLGLLFSLGLDQCSISRLATLSGHFEMFFNGWLNFLCRDLTAFPHSQICPSGL